MKISRNGVNQQNNSSFLPILINCQAPICLFWHIFWFFENFRKYTLQIEVSFLFCKLLWIYDFTLYHQVLFLHKLTKFFLCIYRRMSMSSYLLSNKKLIISFLFTVRCKFFPGEDLNLRWINENPIKIYRIQTSPGKRRAFVSSLLTGL